MSERGTRDIRVADEQNGRGIRRVPISDAGGPFKYEQESGKYWITAAFDNRLNLSFEQREKRQRS